MNARPNPAFWRGRRVLVTGHTGFKGSWLCLMLKHLGAHVSGFALPAPPGLALWRLLQPSSNVHSALGDIADPGAVQSALAHANPEIIMHLAAQPLVRAAYADPAGTFRTNVTGTLNLMEAARQLRDLRAMLVVTSDKVYRNDGSGRAFEETDPLGGHDPYSASKAACEVAASSWAASFFTPRGIALATARAGNVIGGGDFAPERLVPDIYRSVAAAKPLMLRHPHSTRPWQHVLDCLCGYLLYVEKLSAGGDCPLALNFGPAGPAITVAALAQAMLSALGASHPWLPMPSQQLHEADVLSLNSGRARTCLGWEEQLDAPAAIRQTAGWYAALSRGEDAGRRSMDEAAEYLG